MLSVLDNLIHFFGSGLCHQFPERSYEFGGILWPVCARCTGMYLGIVFALAALFLLYRGKQRRGDLFWPYWILLGLALAAMAYDGFSSYLSFRETTNLLRLITGTAVGVSVAPLLYVLLIDTLARSSVDEKAMGGGVRPWTYLLASALLVGTFVYAAGPLIGPLGAIITALSIWVTFTAVILLLVGLVRPFERSVSSWRDLLLPGAISAMISLMLILALAMLKVLLLGSYY